MEVELVSQMVKSQEFESACALLTDMRKDLVELMARTRRISNPQSVESAWDMENALQTMLGRMNRAVAPRLTISLDSDPQLRSLPVDLNREAFWIIREAVTNVLKHSNAVNCTVTLRVTASGLRMTVIDDGYVPFPPLAGKGSGLANMKARAEELNGWCTAVPGKPHGFDVSAYIPFQTVNNVSSLRK
jgi:signal transduction histidine kinase